MSDDYVPTCPECQRKAPLSWVTDRYGIPWRKVCASCWHAVARDIGGFTFDPADAGESLDGDE